MQLRDRILGFARIAPARIRPNPKNWRTHPAEQRDVLRGVLSDIGIVDAVLLRPIDGMPPGKVKFEAWLATYAGDFMLVDGHLRAEEITGQPVPALILDIDEHEEAEVLATFDPVGDMAGMDRGLFARLAAEVESENAAVRSLLVRLGDTEAEDRAFVLEMEARRSEEAERAGIGPGFSGGVEPREPEARDDDPPPRDDAPAPNFAPGTEEQQGRLDQKKPIECPACGELFTR